jgi:hypothetical protein
MEDLDFQIWGEKDAAYLVGMTVPPGEEKQGFDDRILFIDTLALAIALEEDGKLLLEALRKKWPEAVENSMEEAKKLAQEAVSFAAA